MRKVRVLVLRSEKLQRQASKAPGKAFLPKLSFQSSGKYQQCGDPAVQLKHTFTPPLILLVGIKIAGHTAPRTLFAMSAADKPPGRFLGTCLGSSGQRQHCMP